jgi:DNA-binding beta-propeller fold protein YncE
VNKFLCVFLGASIFLTLGGCAGRSGGLFNPDPQVALAWPSPAEIPRIKYFRQIAGPEDFRDHSQTSRVMRWITGDSQQEMPFRAPYGIAADGTGKIWVADPEAHVVHVYDLADRYADYLVRAGGDIFLSPVGVAYDPVRKVLYVSDSGLNKVFVMDDRGRLLGQREPDAGFSRPAGLALDSQGVLYVVDVLKGRIEMFSPEGVHLGGLEGDTDELNRPSNVAVDQSGRIYVTDSLNFRVVVFGSDRKILTTFGGVGDRPGHFARPRGIAVDSQGHIYVSDAAFDNVQIFDLTGNLLLYFGSSGNGPGNFNLPAGLFFDRDDRLYVADSYNRRVQIFQYLPQ